jgi:hypothetical protein
MARNLQTKIIRVQAQTFADSCAEVRELAGERSCRQRRLRRPVTAKLTARERHQAHDGEKGKRQCFQESQTALGRTATSPAKH